MLTGIVSAKYWQTFADCCTNHERVRRTQAVLVRLGQSEVFKVQSQLAHIWRLLNGHLAGFGSILAPRIVWIHESRLILVRCAAASELK